MSPAPEPPLATGTKILLLCFAAKLIWDVMTLVSSWPDLQKPKLGIAIVLPFLMAGLLRNKQWAFNLSGVVCTFWIVFVAAKLIGPMFMVGADDMPFPWSNLIAFPAIVFIVNSLRTDEDIRAEREAAARSDQGLK